jgi:protein SCO1
MPLRRLLLITCALALGTLPAAHAGPEPQGEGYAETTGPEVAERPSDRRRDLPEELEGVGVEERLGETVSASLAFSDSDGRSVTLEEYLAGDLPVALTFVYHDCPMLCSLVLSGLTDVMRQSGMEVGKDYRALAVSINPADTPAQAAAAKEVYTRRLGVEDGDGYVFLTGSAEAVARLTEEVGFRYRWVEAQQEYAHTASVVFLSPQGKITRYLYGIQFPASDFQMALREARAGTVGSPVDQLLLYCFAYDPAAGGYVLQATNAMKLGGLATLLLLSGTLLVFWRREKHKNEAARQAGAPRWGDLEEGLRTAPHS